MASVMKMYANLHAHSTHSDGVYSPRELAKVAYDEGYRAFALTDHDTVTGNDEMIAACCELGIECIRGIEFSTEFKRMGCNMHITAFGIDEDHPEMKGYLAKMSERESEQTRVLFERGISIGYIKGITWDEVLEYNRGISWLCNEHVFRAMKSKGLATDLDYYDFYETCYGKYRATVHSDIEFLDAEELIKLIHSAGGIAFAAHPGDIHGGLVAVEELVRLGLDGIEVWHAMLKGNERRLALALARKHDLYVSGGADHEGLLGGQYRRFERPEESEYYFPPLTLGTTKLFFEEIRDKKKNPERIFEMDKMLADDSLWITNGGVNDSV